MKAATHTEYGAPRVLRVEDVARPALADDQILVQVHASAVTHGDRRLRAADTSFQAVAEEMLKDRAATLLDDPRNRVQEVAARLGYADSASFRKAFKRWFGVTPGAWRRTGGV